MSLPRCFGRGARQRVALLVRLAAIAALLGWAVTSPGMLSFASLLALLNAVSFIGCVAVGMTFITISGNIMSFALGTTLSGAGLIFLSALRMGVVPAFVFAIIFGIGVSALQGAVIGRIKANPILTSIAALAIMLGLAQIITGGQSIYPAAGGSESLNGRIGDVPVGAAFFLCAVLIGQIILSFTRYGRALILTGSNMRAAEAAGIRVARVIVIAYMLAGAFAAVPGVLLAARYGSGDMELGAGYDYSAIAAVLVGGTVIEGGSGSVIRTLVGVTIIALVQVVLILRGFSAQMQYLIMGIIVLGVILLHALGDKR